MRGTSGRAGFARRSAAKLVVIGLMMGALVLVNAPAAGAEIAAPAPAVAAAAARDAEVTTGYSQADYRNLEWVARCKGKTPAQFTKEATAIIAYLVWISRPSEARKLRPLPVIDGPIKVTVRWSGERIPGVDGIGRFFSLDRRQSQRVSVNLFVYLGLLECGPPRGPAPPPLGRPALRQTPTAPTVWDDSDPDVLMASDGSTYLYGSSNNMRLPVRRITTTEGSLSDSKSEWDASPRDAMPTLPAWVNPSSAGGQNHIWAPSAIEFGGRYWLYFGGHMKGATDTVNDQCIGRASATSPLGPFTAESTPIYCGLPLESGSNWWGRGALDPEVLRGQDGRLYMLVALSRTRSNIGVVPLASDGRPAGGLNAWPAILAVQGAPWHDGVDDSTMTSRAFLENPSMVYDPASRTYLLFYSAGEWYSRRYNTGFARCSTPIGPCAVDTRGPILKGNTTRSGPGGLTAYADTNGVLRVAYSTWGYGYEGELNPPNSDGSNSRHLSFGRILTGGSDPRTQTVTLG